MATRIKTTSFSGIVSVALLLVSAQAIYAQGPGPMQTNEDFQRAMEELSNWGRWGPEDELGQANFITAEKRLQAAALVSEGITVSLAHDVVQADEIESPDTSAILKREVLRVSPTGASDSYEYTGSYHGTIHSHLDSLDCHIMYEGSGYNGVTWEEVEAADGCPRGSIHAHRNGIVTRGILFDATLLPGMDPDGNGWVEPGTAITYADLVALEEIQGVTVEPGDVILLHTGRWTRRAALGPWPTSEGVAGYHANVAWFLKERGVAMIGHDMWNDATPSGVGDVFLPLHSLALVSLGVSIFDNLDFADVARVAKELGRYEFMIMASPLRIEKGMGSPLNPLALF
ncbi:MAG: cyclase family protein [Proteobacteria bacterium]|nr:cyclase family protein [Pseudomonadota bacterium]MDA0928523.1 cyclase family protein [Pseudomonadota bacterium]